MKKLGKIVSQTKAYKDGYDDNTCNNLWPLDVDTLNRIGDSRLFDFNIIPSLKKYVGSCQNSTVIKALNTPVSIEFESVVHFTSDNDKFRSMIIRYGFLNKSKFGILLSFPNENISSNLLNGFFCDLKDNRIYSVNISDSISISCYTCKDNLQVFNFADLVEINADEVLKKRGYEFDRRLVINDENALENFIIGLAKDGIGYIDGMVYPELYQKDKYVNKASENAKKPFIERVAEAIKVLRDN